MGHNVGLVIPHRDTPEVLDRCLKTLFQALRSEKWADRVQVLIVDDASEKAGAHRYFESQFAETGAKVLKLIRRHGFTGAANAGIDQLIRQQNAPSIIGILNSDLEFPEQDGPKDWLELCLDSLEEDHEDVSGKRNAMVAPMLVMPDGDTIQWGGEASSLREPGRHKTGSRKAGDCGARMFVRWHTFACVLIRSDALLHVGLLAPNLRMYCSDSDWCLRARDFGYRLVYEPAAFVIHQQSHTIANELQGPNAQNFRGVLFQDQQNFFAKWSGKLFDALDQGPVEQWLGPL